MESVLNPLDHPVGQHGQHGPHGLHVLGTQATFHIGELSEIAAARRAGNELASRLGFDEVRTGQVALVARAGAGVQIPSILDYASRTHNPSSPTMLPSHPLLPQAMSHLQFLSPSMRTT